MLSYFDAPDGRSGDCCRWPYLREIFHPQEFWSEKWKSFDKCATTDAGTMASKTRNVGCLGTESRCFPLKNVLFDDLDLGSWLFPWPPSGCSEWSVRLNLQHRFVTCDEDLFLGRSTSHEPFVMEESAFLRCYIQIRIRSPLSWCIRKKWWKVSSPSVNISIGKIVGRMLSNCLIEPKPLCDHCCQILLHKRNCLHFWLRGWNCWNLAPEIRWISKSPCCFLMVRILFTFEKFWEPLKLVKSNPFSENLKTRCYFW